jgi:Icc-related predicted phosphoesterase
MFHGDFKEIPDGDVFVHAGDMGRAGDEEELAEVAAWIRSLPHEHKVVVPGNHDFLFEQEPAKARALFEGLTVLVDEEVTVAGRRFFGSPWTPEFHSWAFMLPRGRALEEKWAAIPAGLDVLVTHGPPHGILDDAAGYRYASTFDDNDARVPHPAGCEALLARVREAAPRVHLFGHIHNNRGVVERGPTRFVSCTTNESEAPPVVVVVG